MSDLTGKTIQIPADLWANWDAEGLRWAAGMADQSNVRNLLRRIADEIERQCLARMDEPDYGEHVLSEGTEYVRIVDPYCNDSSVEWTDINTGCRVRWGNLVDPRPVGGAS